MKFIDYFKNKNVYGVFDTDLDGISSFILAKYYLFPISKNFNYTLTSDRTMAEFNKTIAYISDIILFVDITPTIDLYKDLLKKNKIVIICDHHISAYNELNSIVKNNYYFTTEKCGAKILFDEITKGERAKKVIYEYVEKVMIYDCWLDNSSLWKQAKDLHNIMYGYVDWKTNLDSNYKYENFVNAQLNKFYNDKHFNLTTYEIELAQKAEKKERENLEQAKKTIQFRIDNSGNKYAYFECSSKLSYVANILLKQHEDIKYIVAHSTWEESAKNILNGKLSLRCGGGFDVSIIAKKWNCGGHPQASGIDLPLDIFEKVRIGKIHLI